MIHFTALHLAVYLQELAIIEIFLKNKSININVENHNGLKPIDLADDDDDKKLKNYLTNTARNYDLCHFWSTLSYFNDTIFLTKKYCILFLEFFKNSF